MTARGRPVAPAPPLTRATKLWYGLGQLGEGLKNESFQLFLLFYYTQVVGLSGALAGQAILIALLFDAVTDPLVGALSDRLRSRWGRRHPFLYASALPVAVSFYLVFAPPAGLSQAGLFAWLTTFTVLCRIAITLFYVPHMALGAELSPDYEERTRIVMTRYYFARAGQTAAGALGLLLFMRPTQEFERGQLNPAAYPPFALTLAVAMAAAILLSAWRTHSRIPYLVTPGAGATANPGVGVTGAGGVLTATLRDGAQAFANRSFRALFVGNTLAFVAWGVTTALSLHLGTYFWRLTTDEMVLYGVGNGVGIFTGLAIWTRATERLDKKTVFVLGLAIYTLFLSGATFLKLVGWWPAWGSPAYLPIFVLTVGLLAHFGLSSTMVTGGSMMADVTDEDALRYGRRREGIFFGAVSFTSKAAFGVGALIAGFVIDGVGLEPGVDPSEVGAAVVRNLGLTLGVSILGLVGLSIAAFSRYELTRERHAQVRAALDAAGA